MCWWAMVAQTGLQAFSMYKSNRAAASVAEAQASGSIYEMNHAFQNYEQERRDSYDAAVNDIIKTRINQMQLNSQVSAAVAEGMTNGGRTADRLVRATEADTARAVSSLQDNYERKSNEIDLNKESTLNSTRDYVANLKAQSKPNKWADILGLASSAIDGYTKYRGVRANVENAHGKWNFWSGGVANNKKTKSYGGIVDRVGIKQFNSLYGDYIFDKVGYDTFNSMHGKKGGK